MPIDRLKRRSLSAPIIEGLVLLAVAPWLLFPSQYPLLTLFALIVVAMLWLWPWLRRKKPLPNTPFNGAILFFEFTILVGIIVTADPIATLPKTTGLILGLTAWRFIVLIVRDRTTLSAATAVFLLLGLGFITLGILGADWKVKVPFLEPILRIIPSRLIAPPEAPSVGVHTNQLAGILLFYFPVVVSLLIGWRAERFRKTALILLLLAAAAIGTWLVLTQSRAGWIGGLSGLAAVLLFWFLLVRSSGKRIIILLSLAAFVLLCLLSLIMIGPDRLRDFWNEPGLEQVIGNLGTVNFRFEVWRWALTAIQDFPFTGTGLGSFRHVVLRLYPIDISPGYDIAHAHNIFLQVGLDAGLPGLISYLSMLIIAFTIGLRSAIVNSKVRPLAIGLLAALFALHVYGMADALALGSKPGLIFWMALGLLGAMYRISLSEGIEQETSDPVEELSLSGAHSD